MNEQLIKKLESISNTLRKDFAMYGAYGVIQEAIQALEKQESERVSAEEVWAKAIEFYNNNPKLYGGKRDGFKEGYIQAMHDFANNSEAMKEKEVDYEFIEWVLDVNNEIFYVSDTTKDIYGFDKIGYYKVSEKFICGTTQELYNIYLTNKEK